MAAKQLIYDEIARGSLRKGIRQLADVVRVTMGPTGRNVILEKGFGAPSVTKDGVTVAKEVELKIVGYRIKSNNLVLYRNEVNQRKSQPKSRIRKEKDSQKKSLNFFH